MLPGKTYTPEDFGKIALRRKWAIILPFVLIGVGTVLVSHYLPNKYRSETVILVVPQQVPESYVRSTVTSRIEDRLQSISQQILSRTRLERIIQDFNLYADERQRGIMEDIVERMRNRDIKVDVLKGDAFRIAYIGDHPQVVMRVTERLASLFIEENMRDRELLAESTNQFLGVQLEDTRRRLIEQEKKLQAYRAQYAGQLPSQAESNLQQIQNLQMQVQAVVESLNRDGDRRLLVERALADLKSEGGGGGGMEQPELPVASQLAASRKALSEMLLRLKPEHPDVVRMKRVIAGLEQRAETEALNAPLSPEAAAPTSSAQALHRNRERALRQELENLDRQISSKRAEEQRLRNISATYQSRLEAVPARETELAELTRDYVTTQALYQSLLAKTEDSKIAANLERREIGEQFKVLDPARAAQKPYSPNRTRINLLGILGGLGFGLAMAGLLEYRDSSFRTQEEVTSVLSLPVLAQIPFILTPTERRRVFRKRLVIAAAATAVCVVVGGVFWRLGILSSLLQMI